jgi:hypothetical protein
MKRRALQNFEIASITLPASHKDTRQAAAFNESCSTSPAITREQATANRPNSRRNRQQDDYGPRRVHVFVQSAYRSADRGRKEGTLPCCADQVICSGRPVQMPSGSVFRTSGRRHQVA